MILFLEIIAAFFIWETFGIIAFEIWSHIIIHEKDPSFLELFLALGALGFFGVTVYALCKTWYIFIFKLLFRGE